MGTLTLRHSDLVKNVDSGLQNSYNLVAGYLL